MERRIWRAAGPISGVLFVVVLFGGGGVPGSEDVHMVIEIAGLLFLLPFIAFLAGMVREAEDAGGWLSGTVLAAGTLALAVKLGSGASSIAARDQEGALADALQAMNDAAFMLMMLPLGVMVAAVAIASIRTDILPTWLGWASAVVGVALLVNGTNFEAEFGPAFLLFALWTLVTSALLLLRARSAPRRATAAPAPRGAT